jgi:hypothetical protein
MQFLRESREGVARSNRKFRCCPECSEKAMCLEHFENVMRTSSDR